MKDDMLFLITFTSFKFDKLLYPLFWDVHAENSPFSYTTPYDPFFFYEILHRMPPWFRSPVGTYLSLSYSKHTHTHTHTHRGQDSTTAEDFDTSIFTSFSNRNTTRKVSTTSKLDKSLSRGCKSLK